MVCNGDRVAGTDRCNAWHGVYYDQGLCVNHHPGFVNQDSDEGHHGHFRTTSRTNHRVRFVHALDLPAGRQVSIAQVLLQRADVPAEASSPPDGLPPCSACSAAAFLRIPRDLFEYQP